MYQWSPMDAVLAIVSIVLVGWGLFQLAKAVATAVARAWFAEKEKHAKRIIELAKGDKE